MSKGAPGNGDIDPSPAKRALHVDARKPSAQIVGFKSQIFGGVRQDGVTAFMTYMAHRNSKPTGVTTMNKTITRGEVAALLAERDLLRARLSKVRHHKKPYAEMTPQSTAPRSINSASQSSRRPNTSACRIASRSATPAEHHLSPIRSPSCFASLSASASAPTISRPSDLTRDITPGSRKAYRA